MTTGAGRHRRYRRWGGAGIPLLLAATLLAGAAVPTHAAFTGTASNGGNSITAGSVSFGANAPVTAVLTATAALPGSTGSGCVKVTYQGSVPATVKVYVAPGGLTGTGLGAYLIVQVNEGTGSNAGCSDFARVTTGYNPTGLSDTGRTLAAFAAGSTNYATGAGAWAATPNATRTYQFLWRAAADNAAESKTMSVTFTWEAQA